MNKQTDKMPVPKKQTWAQITALEILDEIMNEEDPAAYVEKLLVKNNGKPNHIHEPKENRRPKVATDKEKIARTIHIKNINWNEARNHQVGHMKNKADARRETLAKANAYEDTRIRYAIYLLHCKLGIAPSKQRTITEAWSATQVESKIMWIRCDRGTVDMIRQVKKDNVTPVDIEFMEFLPCNHMKIRNKIKQQCITLKFKQIGGLKYSRVNEATQTT